MGHSRMNPDFSTINIAALKRLKAYELPPSYHLQDEPGNGCFGDAPGYPTYFTRNVYTGHGNCPPYREGRVTQVISFEGKLYVTQWHGQTDEAHQKLLRKLWKPLPVDHLRTKLWMTSLYRHMAHCYQDVERPEYGRPGTLIFPIPAYKVAVAKDIKVSASATDEEIAAARRAQQAEVDRINAVNEAEQIRAKRVATPENHNAVRSIREFYPDHQPDLGQIAKPGPEQGEWWTIATERPTAANCPGPYRQHPHNENGCQFCGRYPKKS